MRSTCHLFSDGSQSPQGTIFKRLLRTTPFLLFLTNIATLLPAADRTDSSLGLPPSIASNSPIREIGPGLFSIGQIRLDQSNRSITLPAFVNLRAGALEYVLVTDSGKIHESLLRTSVAPYHLQLALLLVGLSPSGNNASTNASSDLTIEIAWTVKRRTRSFPVGRFVQERRARKAIGTGRWSFTGSRFRDDGFAAQVDGSLVTLIDDPDAIVGSRMPGFDDDDNWLAIGQKLPPSDTPVNLIFRPVRHRPKP